MSETPYRVWLDLEGRPGWQNMAIDHTLLERGAGGERWLRLYRWEPGCLSFGRHEPAMRRYDRERIESLGLDTVRRPTGGRAVWHAEELTYAVAAPSEALGALREAYHAIHGVLLSAIHRLGAAAELAPAGRSTSVDAGACFAVPVGGEILTGGRKLVGSAQVRAGGGLLQHGSILLDGTQDVVRDVTRAGSPRDLATSLADAIDPAPGAEQVAHAIAQAAGELWSTAPVTHAGGAEVLRDACHHESRYRSPDWTWNL